MRGKKKVAKVMREFKAGTLHSGKGGKVVRSRRQAVAIAMSEAGMSRNSNSDRSDRPERLRDARLKKQAADKAKRSGQYWTRKGYAVDKYGRPAEGARHERSESKAEQRREYGKVKRRSR
jgi:hypothetical protein